MIHTGPALLLDERRKGAGGSEIQKQADVRKPRAFAVS